MTNPKNDDERLDDLFDEYRIGYLDNYLVQTKKINWSDGGVAAAENIDIEKDEDSHVIAEELKTKLKAMLVEADREANEYWQNYHGVMATVTRRSQKYPSINYRILSDKELQKLITACQKELAKRAEAQLEQKKSESC